MTRVLRSVRVLVVAALLVLSGGASTTGATTDGALPDSGLTAGSAHRSLVAWWPGNGSARDVAGHHPSRRIGDTGFAPGVVRRAFDFDGSGDLVRSPDNPDWTLGNHAFSIALWVRIDSSFERQSFVGHDEGANDVKKWIFWFDALGHREPFGSAVRFHINSPTTGPLDPLVYPWQPTLGQWYHLVLTRSANFSPPSVYRLYVNGARVMTEQDGHRIRNAAAPLRLGYSERNFFLDGGLDEVMLFNSRLTAAQVKCIYSAGTQTGVRVPARNSH